MSTTANALQRERIDELTRKGDSGYPSPHYGKRILAAFECYLTRGRAEHITAALYDFLHMHAGYIAHFDLQGFRHRYRDPADLLNASHETGGGFSGYGPVKVYSDGMTHLEVWDGIAALVAKHRTMVLERSARERAEAELAQAREIAARHGLQLTPAPDRGDGAG